MIEWSGKGNESFQVIWNEESSVVPFENAES